MPWRNQRIARFLLTAVSILGWGILLAQLATSSGSFVHSLVILFFVASAWANYLKIEHGPVSVNQAFAFELLAVLFLDPVRAAWIGALAYIAGTGIPQRHSLDRNLANGAIIGISTLAMGLVYQGLGGYDTLNERGVMDLVGLLAVLVSSLAHFTVNSLLVYAIVLSRPAAPNLKVIGKTIQWDLLAKFVFAPLAWYIYLAYQPATALHLAPPMIFVLGIWLLLKNTMELNQTKTDLGRNISILEHLHDFSREAFASLDLNEVLATAVRRCTALSEGSYGAMFVLDEYTREPYVGYEGSTDRHWLAYLHSPELDRLVQALVHADQPLPDQVTPRLGGYWLTSQDSQAETLGISQVLAFPLYDNSRVEGVLVIGLPDEREPDEAAMQTLAIICMEVTQAMTNAEMHTSLRRDQERRLEELALAEKIQRRALEKNRRVALPGVRVESYFRPARSVGGDYYDIIRIAGNRLAIVMGDVSGKGIPAALTMMSVLNRVQVWTNDYRTPDRVLELLNSSLVEPARAFDEVLQYSTAVFGILDLETQRFTYSMAGHERPLLLHSASHLPIPLEGEGYPLGLFAESTYTARTIQLAPGDRLIFFTDGITDMRSSEGTRLTRDGFAQLVAQVHSADPEDFPAELIRTIKDIAGIDDKLLVDDQALVIVEITNERPVEDRPVSAAQTHPQGGIQPAVC